MTTYAFGIAGLGAISGLNDDEKDTLQQLWKCWASKTRRNLIRSQYYDQRNVLKDMEIAIPPHLADVELVLGWPAKAVDTLARRCVLEDFTFPSVDADPLGVKKLWADNDMDVELPQTITSTFVHSCTFMAASQGDIADGEPEVLISSQSALYAAGLWDHRRRRLRAAFMVTELDDMGRVVEFIMFLDGLTVRGRWDRKWQIERFPHSLDRLPVEVLPYGPRLDRPFGRSRISRAVMGLSDSALRTLVRSEVHAEFFSAPQRYAMGADETMFQDADGEAVSQWEAIMGRVWAAPRDEDGEVPQLGQFQATSPQPHVDQMRMLASLFCGESGLPLSALGIVHDNPASAEAIEAAERDLIIEAHYAMRTLGPRISRIMRTAVEIRDGSVPDNIHELSARWSPPENRPLGAAGDAVSKIVAALPYLAESEIPLELMDLDEATIRRAMVAKRKAGVSQLMTSLNGNAAGTPTGAGAGQRPGPGQNGAVVGAGPTQRS